MSTQAVESDMSFGLVRALSRAARGRKPGPDASPYTNPQETPDAVSAPVAKSQPLQEDGQEIWPLPGLAPMTRVRTSFGDVHSIALRKGDDVLVRGGEYLPILWINRIKLDEHILSLKPDSNPVVIGAGALGPSTPSAEIMVSPRQIVAADDRSGLGSSREAAMLVSRPGVRRLRETGLTYTVFHVGRPAEVYCEGLFLKFPMEA